MKYAVIKISGKQFKVSEGDILEVAKIEGKKGDKIDILEVLLLANEKKIEIGQPFVKNINVKAEILDQFKGDKIRIAKFKAKSRYRRVLGFRPELTRIKIIKIS